MANVHIFKAFRSFPFLLLQTDSASRTDIILTNADTNKKTSTAHVRCHTVPRSTRMELFPGTVGVDSRIDILTVRPTISSMSLTENCGTCVTALSGTVFVGLAVTAESSTFISTARAVLPLASELSLSLLLSEATATASQVGTNVVRERKWDLDKQGSDSNNNIQQ